MNPRGGARKRWPAEAGFLARFIPWAPQRLEAVERAAGSLRPSSLLSPDQRHCIELAFFEGLTHTQIAERLQAPLGTVKSRILLGMNKLRQTLSA